jgi:YidC/Oxa1 family membrane protein insertase
MLGSIWNNFLLYPVLNTLLLLYQFLGENLGWAVIVLAIVVRLLLIRSTKKQMEMTKTMATLKPKMDELNKKYKNNKEKLAQEQIKLYKETGYNPLGCLTNFVPQMIILIVIIQVIRVVTMNDIGVGVYSFVEDLVIAGERDFVLNTNFYGIWDLSKTYTPIAQEFGYFARQALPYLLLALFVGFVQYVATAFMQAMQEAKPVKKSKTDEQMSPEEMQKQMMKSMTKIFPLLTVYITLTVPSVLGLYWLAQSVMLVVQYYFIDKEKTISTFRKLNPFNRGVVAVK